jgi:hypothetical protein
LVVDLPLFYLFRQIHKPPHVQVVAELLVNNAIWGIALSLDS